MVVCERNNQSRFSALLVFYAVLSASINIFICVQFWNNNRRTVLSSTSVYSECAVVALITSGVLSLISLFHASLYCWASNRKWKSTRIRLRDGQTAQSRFYSVDAIAKMAPVFTPLLHLISALSVCLAELMFESLALKKQPNANGALSNHFPFDLWNRLQVPSLTSGVAGKNVVDFDMVSVDLTLLNLSGCLAVFTICYSSQVWNFHRVLGFLISLHNFLSGINIVFMIGGLGTLLKVHKFFEQNILHKVFLESIFSLQTSTIAFICSIVMMLFSGIPFYCILRHTKNQKNERSIRNLQSREVERLPRYIYCLAMGTFVFYTLSSGLLVHDLVSIYFVLSDSSLILVVASICSYHTLYLLLWIGMVFKSRLRFNRPQSTVSSTRIQSPTLLANFIDFLMNKTSQSLQCMTVISHRKRYKIHHQITQQYIMNVLDGKNFSDYKRIMTNRKLMTKNKETISDLSNTAGSKSLRKNLYCEREQMSSRRREESSDEITNDSLYSTVYDHDPRRSRLDPCTRMAAGTECSALLVNRLRPPNWRTDSSDAITDPEPSFSELQQQRSTARNEENSPLFGYSIDSGISGEMMQHSDPSTYTNYLNGNSNGTVLHSESSPDNIRTTFLLPTKATENRRETKSITTFTEFIKENDELEDLSHLPPPPEFMLKSED